MSEIRIFKDNKTLTEYAAELFVKISGSFIEANGKFTLALSGGNTPLELYRLLATEKYADKIQWNRIFIFWGDERMVPATHPSNNSHQARIALLDHIHISPENIFAVPVGYPAEKAAMRYSETIRTVLQNDAPSFDLIFLGLGEDAHTASLFPNHPILKDASADVKHVLIENDNGYDRVSFTPGMINNAKNIIFMVTGKNKRNAVARVIEGEPDPQNFPAQLITGTDITNLYWLLDSDAAALLSEKNNKQNN